MTVDELNTVAVIGAGTMGCGIAQALALAGYATTLYDVDVAASKKARESIVASLSKGVELGRVPEGDRDLALERLRMETDLGEAVVDADLVIEAIHESMPAKRELFAELDARSPERAILTSNTSSLSIGMLAEATARPSRVGGLHFFNPVHAMPLIEIVIHDAVDEDVVVIDEKKGSPPGRGGPWLAVPGAGVAEAEGRERGQNDERVPHVVSGSGMGGNATLRRRGLVPPCPTVGPGTNLSKDSW